MEGPLMSVNLWITDKVKTNYQLKRTTSQKEMLETLSKACNAKVENLKTVKYSSTGADVKFAC